MFELLYDIDNLYNAFLQVKEASVWKEETQLYEMYLVPNLNRLSNAIKNQTYVPTQPRIFFMNERGKPRCIESRTVDDRIVQCVVHTQIIMPAIKNKLIYDNAASIENRGTDFFRRRLEYHLSDFAAHHGTNGYILLIDFKKFFDNIWHSVFIEMLRPLIPDKLVMSFIEMLVYSNRIDVSYMSDEEYANCMYVPFNNLEYRMAVAQGLIKCTGEKFMYKGMGLGSQISQDAGIFVPHRIDNYIKIVCGIKPYARYMDDSYIIHESKEFLWDLLGRIKEMTMSLGIFINEKKTQVVNLKHEFTILQTRYKLYPNGSIAVMPNNDTFIRESHKLLKQAELLNIPSSKMTYDMIDNSYRSWKGAVLHNTDGRYVEPLIRTDKLYDKLFIDPFITGGY